jgi:glycosyltransferase involved in cell wall biosynthesis
MNSLDCLVHPQVGTEAFGAVLIEAFSCGKPVIASALDGVPEAFAAGKVGKLVPPESVPDLAQAMCDVASRPPLNESQRQELHDRIRSRFSLEVSVSNTLALYREVLRRAPGSGQAVFG